MNIKIKYQKKKKKKNYFQLYNLLYYIIQWDELNEKNEIYSKTIAFYIDNIGLNDDEMCFFDCVFFNICLFLYRHV